MACWSLEPAANELQQFILLGRSFNPAAAQYNKALVQINVQVPHLDERLFRFVDYDLRKEARMRAGSSTVPNDFIR